MGIVFLSVALTVGRLIDYTVSASGDQTNVQKAMALEAALEHVSIPLVIHEM